jgi:subtilisin family serine protease
VSQIPAAPGSVTDAIELIVGESGLAGRTGRGVAVAIIDSGVNAAHPHIGGIADAFAISPEGRVHSDVVDRLGHGTAITAAIHEKAPGAELRIVKVFHDTLSTNLEALIAAIDTAADQGARLINLSLGTANPDSAAALRGAVERAAGRGSIVISAAAHGGRAWYPGSLPPTLGVTADSGCPRGAARFSIGGRLTVEASPYARPIPGVPPERNLNGVSFAVANATGIVACLLEGRGLLSLPEIAGWVRRDG